MSTIRKSGISVMLAMLWLCASGSLPAQTFTTVFSFDGRYGSHPFGLVQVTDGNLYGTTKLSDGTIFKITPSGTLTTLGGESMGALILATDGNFYGTTATGGVNGCKVDRE
jgi:hypothetical protein